MIKFSETTSRSRWTRAVAGPSASTASVRALGAWLSTSVETFSNRSPGSVINSPCSQRPIVPTMNASAGLRRYFFSWNDAMSSGAEMLGWTR